MEVFREVYPEAFYSRFLEHSLRPDGRQLQELRALHVSADTMQATLGSAMVKVGKTSVVCGVTGQIGPRADAAANLVSVHVELTPLSSPDIRPGPPVPQAGILKHKLTTLLCSAGLEVVPADQLRIVDAGRDASAGAASVAPLYWHLQLDVYCVDDDGCVYDACLLACVSALKHTRLPVLQWDAASGRFVTVAAQPQQPSGARLTLRNAPYAVSFAVLDKWVVADPCHEEEALASSLLHVVWGSDGMLRSIDKPGGAAIEHSHLVRCIALARTRMQTFAAQ